MPTEITNNTSMTIGASLEQVLPKVAFGKRIEYVLTNTSTGGQQISLALSETTSAADGKGIVLKVGQSHYASISDGYPMWQGPITGIASGGGATLAIFVRVVQ